MKNPTKFLTVATVFLLGMSGFCYQALAQTHGAMGMEATALSYESPCGSTECYSPSSQCCDDNDHELALLSLRANSSLKKHVSSLPFQFLPFPFQSYERRPNKHSALFYPAPPLSLTGIIVKKE